MRNRPVQTAGGLMIAGALLANVAFVLLGSSFDYPDVLRKPAGDVLRTFHQDAGQIAPLFAVLAAASAILIPTAWLSRHLVVGRRARRVVVAAGVAAGVVQVVGLLRWPALVPHLADIVSDPAATSAAKADAIDTFQVLHTVLGGVVGEALGYVLTAVWTIAMVRNVARRPGRWFAPLGYASAALIVTGLLEPLGVGGAGLANFVGYLAWSGWMIAFGTSLVRHGGTRTTAVVAGPTEVPLVLGAPAHA